MALTDLQQNDCEKIWKQYKAEVERLCKYKLASVPCDIDDVVAATFCVFCEKYEKIEIWNPRGYLLGIANNLIIDEYNKAKKEKKLLNNIEDKELMPVNANKIEDFIIEKVRSEKIPNTIVNEVLDEMSKEEKEFIQYRYNDKMKFKEIGTILGISESAAKQKNLRIKVKVKKIIEKKLINY